MEQKNLAILEDCLRANIVRAINISTRVALFSVGSGSPTQSSTAVCYDWRPEYYRLSLIRHFYFELVLIEPDRKNYFTDIVGQDLENIRSIPILDLAHVLFRRHSNLNLNDYWDNVFKVILKIIKDDKWWTALEESIACTNRK